MSTTPARQAVVELCLALSRRGYLAGTGGNIALRIDDRHIAVTPSATDYLEMTAEDVCVLRLADLARVEGERTPSVESGLHARVLKARPDVACSIHTHQPVASACALLGRALAVDDEALRRALGPKVPIVGYAPSGTRWLSWKLGRALRPELNAYLMLNHGVLCCGASITAAVQAVEALEALSRHHLLGLMARQAERHPGRKAALDRVAQALAHSSPSSP